MTNEKYNLLLEDGDYRLELELKNPALRELYLKDPENFYHVLSQTVDEAIGSIFVSDGNKERERGEWDLAKIVSQKII
ncbi:hypothetical protein HY449_01855 [Candidatus Pacearchaeota archaeon]|nr:hypothetical protein [Candidatus Pacearchaeota archaeon]